jgi:hypothetical protein
MTSTKTGAGAPRADIPESVIDIGKGYAAKRAKVDDVELIVSTLKFSKLKIQADHCDGIIGAAPGWWREMMLNDMGLPRWARIDTYIPSAKLALTVTGVIRGATETARLVLLQAELTGVELEVCELGAYLSGTLSWRAAGDEVSDVEDLLGRTCVAKFAVFGSQQQDLPLGAAPATDVKAIAA